MSNENKKERKKDGHIVLNSNSFKLGLAMGSPLGCDPLLALQIWFASVCWVEDILSDEGRRKKKKAKQKKEKKKKKYVQEELRHRANKREKKKKLVSYP